MASTQFPSVKNSPSKVQLSRLAHVSFEHPDLAAFHNFADDFGLVEAWRNEDTILYRGYGKDPYCYAAKRATTTPRFCGPAFVAQSEEEFRKAALLRGAVVNDLAPYPGGGKQVTIHSPAGYPFLVVYGQEERQAAKSPATKQVESLGPYNGAFEKKRLGESAV